MPVSNTAAVPNPISDLTSDALLLSKPSAVNRANSSSATDELSILTALVLDIPNVNDACAPISDRTSDVDLLSSPLAVNLANSSSATELLSIFTALVFDIPNVKDACAPISDNTSDADRPSMSVPSTLRKSLSATPEVNLATLVFDIPVSNTAAVPRPSDVLAVEPDSATKLLPSPTIKLPLVTARPATS